MFKIPILDIQQFLINLIGFYFRLGNGCLFEGITLIFNHLRRQHDRQIRSPKEFLRTTALLSIISASYEFLLRYRPIGFRARSLFGVVTVGGALFFVPLLGGSAHAQDSITVMALFKGQAMVLINGKQRLLKVGKPSPEGLLLLKADSDRAEIEFAGERRHYELGRRISTRFTKPPTGISTTIWPDRNGMYLAIGSINSYPVRFLIDTGATLIAMSRGQARRLGIDYEIIGEPSLSATASGVVRSYTVRLARVKIGEIQLRDVPATVIDADAPRQVLLGNSFLNRLRMRRDGAAMVLTKP